MADAESAVKRLMDQQAKRKLLRDIPSGLYVIGVGTGDTPDAFTGSWLSQCSMAPPTVALGLRGDSRALAEIREHRAFTVNFVSKDGVDLVKQFAASDRTGEGRLGGTPYTTGETGTPILDAAIGYLECRLVELIEGFGDHAIAVAEVVAAEMRSDEAPLVMADTGWNYGG